MNLQQLEQGRKINDKVKDLERVFDHFSFKPQDDPQSVLVNFFTNCGNLGSKSLKDNISAMLLQKTKEYLLEEIRLLNDEFEKL